MEACWTSWKLDLGLDMEFCHVAQHDAGGYILQAGEELNGVHDAVRECDHNACAGKGETAPQLVRYEGCFSTSLTVVHPGWEGAEKENTDSEKRGRLG